MTIEEVAEGTYRLEARVPEARFTFSAYLLTGTEAVLIEPGPGVMVPPILEALERLGIRRLSYIIPTHIHMDHGGGAGRLAELFPEARVVVHPRGARHAIDPARLIAATRMVYGDDFEDTYGPILPVPKAQVQVAADGDAIHGGGRELRIIHTPGHASHQLAILDGRTGGLFCGEALGTPLPGPEPSALPSVSVGDLDVDLYLASIDKLSKLRPSRLFFSHEGGVREPDDIPRRLADNTLMLRDVILEGLKNGMATADIERRLQGRFPGHQEVRRSAPGMESIVLGYAAYFRKKGLI